MHMKTYSSTLSMSVLYVECRLLYVREMLCSLVRRAFKQTEEQQLQFEQMLKHDYGRRSKGEVRVASTLTVTCCAISSTTVM